jgi:glycerol-3-phosphate dehydrogenase (NAD(P)+)
MTTQAHIAVLGAGAWGTALAIQLARNHCPVTLWTHLPEEAATLQTARCNERYLKGIVFPHLLTISDNLAATVAAATDVLIAVPSHAFRSVAQQLVPLVNDDTGIVFATKGLDEPHPALLHTVVQALLGDKRPMAVLSGPSFAVEVARGLPTAITLAANSTAFAEKFRPYLHSNTFRVYTNKDMVGVELGGAMKNVLAIAVGMADGFGLGANARAGLITRGLHEMTHLGKALGAEVPTLMGLSGLGDLVLTCTDNQSRNRRYGLAVGRGESREAAEQSIGVVEGIRTARLIYALGKQHQVALPIVNEVYAVLYEGRAIATAVQALLAREPKAE